MTTPTETLRSAARSIRRAWHLAAALRWRLAIGLALGALGGLGAAGADVVWARRGMAAAPPSWTLLQLDAGLLVPWFALFGLLIGLASYVVHPAAPPSRGRLAARLRGCGVGRPADFAAFVPLATLGALGWAVGSAQLARQVLALDLPATLCGLLVALAALGLGLGLGVVVLALTPWLRRLLAIASARSRRFVDPVWTLSVALVLSGLVIGWGVVRGGPSGEGGLLGIFGVLKRQELDLRASGIALLLAGALYLLPGLLGALRAYQALIGTALALSLTVHSAVGLDRAPEVAQFVERRAPLGRTGLALLRKLTDRDRDGASRWFAGGDCDDSDAAIGPGATDRPDNGIDEDCSGSDLSLAGLAPPPAPAGPTSKGVADRVPADGNVILISIDALRSDLGFAGYARPISPNLDAFARRSVVFERAYALASYTGKAVGPMLIGKYGSETHRNWGHFNVFGPEDTFLAERLQRAGIRTLSVQGHRYFGRFGGLDRGFDLCDLSAAPPEGASWATDSEITSDKMTDAALALLGKPEHTARRFFLWIHYLDPHADYKVHPDAPKFGSDARALYDSEVAFTDRQVGRLLEFVAAAPWASRTSIIITSDHGEAFGENGMWRHGFELWEVLVRVPLLVHVPGIEPGRIAAKRSLIDLAPTILELLRLPLPPSGGATEGTDFLSGQSWLPDLYPEPGKRPEDRDVLIDMPAGPYNEARRALIHGELKLIISREAHRELYDLAADPGETRDLWRTRRGEVEQAYELTRARLREIKVTGSAGR